MAQPAPPPPAPHPDAPPAPSPYATRPYPTAEDPAVTHADQLGSVAKDLEAMRQRLANTLDSESLAALQSAVTMLASLAGNPPGLSQPVTSMPPDAPPAPPAPRGAPPPPNPAPAPAPAHGNKDH